MKFSILSTAAVAALAFAGASQAATVFFSTTSSGAQPITNPVVNLAAGASQTLYMWASLDPDLSAVGDGPSEKLIGLAVDAVGDSSLASASAWTTVTPTRWQVNTAPTYSNSLFSGLALGAITTAGLDGGGTAQNGIAGSGFLRVGSFVVTAGAAAGTENVKLRVGTQTVAYAAGQGGPNIFFGAGDAGVNGASIGATSQLADLTINVTGGGEIPEPATLSLAAIAGLGLVRRRRA